MIRRLDRRPRWLFRYSGPILFLWILLTLIPVYGSSNIRLRIDEQQDTARISMSFSKTVSFTTQVDNRELILRFSEPIEIENLNNLSLQSSNWIDGVTASYDVVLIRSSKDVQFTTQKSHNLIEVHLSPMVDSSSRAENEEARLQLALLEAQLFIETSRFSEASSLLLELHQKYPQDADVAATLAWLEHTLEKRRPALELYGEALDLEPDNEDYLEAEETLGIPYRPKVEVGLENKTVSDAQNEWIQQTRAQVSLSPHLLGGFNYDLNHVDSGILRLSDGTIGSFTGLRHRAEIYFSYDFHEGGSLKSAVLTDGSGAGGALRYQRPDNRGSFDFRLDYRRPNWDFVEGLVNGINRDRIQLRRTHRFRWNLLASVSAAGNRYRTQEYGIGAKSTGIEANLMFQVPEKSVFIEYGVEAEYRHSIMERLDSMGTPYFPVPLISREIHFIDATFSKQWTEMCSAEAFGGMSKDRLGGSGPFAGATLKCEPRKGLGAHLWVDHRLNSADTSQAVLRLGGSLFWRF